MQYSCETWLVGAGAMAREYTRVLKALGQPFKVIGRGEESAAKFLAETGVEAVTGGVEAAAGKLGCVPEKAIVAVDVNQLSAVAQSLISLGVKQILVEKPGFASPAELPALVESATSHGAEVYLAYNRRFYASVLAAEKIIEADGGLQSMHFEFTEWSRSVTAIERPASVFANWFYANSTHVVDLAFFIGGWPEMMNCYTKGELEWHSPAVFAGAGVTSRGALFSYCANWDAPGRWAVELLTRTHRLYLKPMEQLQIQQLNSVKVEPVEIDDKLDREFKPGLYKQTEAFINGDTSRLCTLAQQAEHVANVYNRIDGREQ